MSNGYMTKWENIRGIILGPITVGGALQQNNITPGTLVTSLGSRNIYDAQTLKDALKSHEPGERVLLTVIEQIGPNVFRERDVLVTLGSYPE